jgi:hypothetical protein
MAEHVYKPKLDEWEMHLIIRALWVDGSALMVEDRAGYKEVEALKKRLSSMLIVDEEDMAELTARAEQSIAESRARAAEERAKLYEGAEPILVGIE